MPVQYTSSGHVQRVQADSILETKMVIQEMLLKQQECLEAERAVALNRARLRGQFASGIAQPGYEPNFAVARTRLERQLRPLETEQFQWHKRATEVGHCLQQLDSYLANIQNSELKQQDFFVHYQPIISLQTGKIVAFEALVRWQRFQDGFAFPGDFIHFAEEVGLIVHLDRWVLQQACSKMSQWRDQYPHLAPLTVNVNLSGALLCQDDFLNHLMGVLEEADLSESCLQLEVAESNLSKETDLAASRLQTLQAMGIQWSLDDFSGRDLAVQNPERFVPSILNLSRSLINGITEPKKAKVVSRLATAARELGVAVLAKGVEPSQQLDQLRTMPIDFAQGYFFSKPIDSQEAGELIARNPHW